jgi:hypothetical protein
MRFSKLFLGYILLAVSILAIQYLLIGAGIMLAAIFTVSPIMGEMRGKAGSDVFSKNHFGGFIRKRVKGTNPRTVKQINVRAFMTDISKAWKTLDDTDRIAWNNYASGRQLKNRLGSNITLTGESTYIKLNRNLQTVGATLIDTPPSANATPPELLAALGVAIVSATSITVSCTTAPSAHNFVEIYASKPLSQGRYYNSAYRFLGLWKTADTNSFAITTLYTNVFGALPVADEKVFFKFISTSDQNGLQNQAQVISEVV